MVMEAAVREGDSPEKPRLKTPLWLLAGGAALAGTIILVGLKSGMEPEVQTVKEVTTQGAPVEGSSMARLLEQQRRDVEATEAAEVGKPPMAARGPEAAGPSAAAPSVAGAAYVEPTGTVPKYAFQGSGKCDELATLEERLKCLDSQFVYETRSVRLKELGDSMTADDNLFIGEDPASERSDDQHGAMPPLEPGGWLPLRPLNGGDQGSGTDIRPTGGQGNEPTSRDASARFHRTGGAEYELDGKASALKTPSTRFWLRSGSVLPCEFISGVTSQLPGQVEAQISYNVYDSIDQRHLLIPAGSVIVGRPNPEIGPGQDRIQFAWTELHLPDGEFRELGGMAGADGAGMAGVEGKVNRHWGRKLGLALMTSTINVSFHLAAPSPRTGSPQDAVAQGVGEGVVQTATENLRKMMQIPDEITIKPGQTCMVKVARSLEFPKAYSDGKRWRR